jgi:hypothetical protein
MDLCVSAASGSDRDGKATSTTKMNDDYRMTLTPEK